MSIALNVLSELQFDLKRLERNKKQRIYNWKSLYLKGKLKDRKKIKAVEDFIK